MTVAPAEASAGRRARRLSQRLFPGERLVWIVAASIIAAASVITVIALLQPREDLLGSNSVGARTDTAIVPANTPMCIPHIRVPAGTGRVRFNLDTRTLPRPAMEVQIREEGGTVVRGTSPPSSQSGHGDYEVTVPTLPAKPSSTMSEVCLIAKGEVITWGVDTPQSNVPSPTVGGKAIPNRVGVWFLGPPGAHRSIGSQIGEMFRRAALYRPGFVGPWTYWALFLIVLPLLAYAALRLLATADLDLRRRVPLPLAVGLIAFSVAATWALVTPAWQSPDESEHFAYVQYFAETGKAVETNPASPLPVYSDSEGFALEAVYHTSVIELVEAKPPWLKAQQEEYEKQLGGHHLREANGGGYHPATSPHTPAYYALLAPAYLLTRLESPFAQLFAMRLTSALMGALVAVLAMLIVLELLPGRRGLAVAAGLIIGFEPMFGFIAGAVNNDNGVNLADALIVYLMVRALRRGLSLPLAIAAGATLVVAPLMKGTGYELYPPAILALALAMLRRHRRENWMALGAMAVTFALLQFGWSQLAPLLHHTTFSTPGGGAPGLGLSPFHDPKRYLSWMIRFMLPFSPPFIHHDWTIVHWPFFNVYIERGFAAFGWYAIYFPKWVYLLIVLAFGASLVMGIAVLVRRHEVLRRRWPEIAFLVFVPVTVICAVEASFQPPLGIIPLNGTPEAGRYAFPAITAVAALFIGTTFAFGRRRALPIATAAVAGLIGLTVASQLLTLSGFYT